MWGTGIHLGHDLPFRTLSQPSPAVPSPAQPCPVQPSHVQSSKLLAAGGTASAEEGGKDWDRGQVCPVRLGQTGRVSAATWRFQTPACLN